MKDTFFLDTEDGSQECRIITSLYSEDTNTHYLIYEAVDNSLGEIFVSSYDPNDETNTLYDVTEEQLKEVEELLGEDFDYE